MKVLLDVDVILDILGATEDVLYSFQALDVMLLKRFEPFMTASMAPTVQYVLSARTYASRPGAVSALKNLTDIIRVLDVTEVDLRRALADPLGDFEDAMIAWAAFRHGIDLIVTRNVRDFAGSPVAAVTPQQFCEIYCPVGYEYDLAGF